MGGLRPRIDGAYGASRAPAALLYRGDGCPVGDPYQLGNDGGSPPGVWVSRSFWTRTDSAQPALSVAFVLNDIVCIGSATNQIESG